MIERVAKAIYEADVSPARVRWENRIPDGHIDNTFMAMAVAAIEALREPTEAMSEAGFHEIKPDGLPADKGDAAACFTVMIDAALKDNPNV